jgi:hypothetical protein
LIKDCHEGRKKTQAETVTRTAELKETNIGLEIENDKANNEKQYTGVSEGTLPIPKQLETNKECKHSTPLQEDSRPEVNPLTPGEARKKMVIGASNCRDLLFEDPGVIIKAQSGLCAKGIEQFLDKECTLAEVELVVLHLGTNDLKDSNNDSDEVIMNLQAAESKVRTRAPDLIQIGVCSIPPKRGSSNGCEIFNSAVTSVNKFMNKFCEKLPDVMFIDNNSFLLTENNKLKKKMYNLSDKSGIHYSAEGIKLS